MICGSGICEPSKDYRNFTCHCQHGFTGRFCEIQKAPSCSQRKVPCQNNGKCHDILNGIVCECPKGTYGRRCEILDEKASPNWGILSLQDPNDFLANVPQGFKRIGTVVVTKIGTLKAFRSQLRDLFDEIWINRDVNLTIARLSGGPELIYDVIHFTNETKDDVVTVWKALVTASVSEEEHILNLEDVIDMLNNPTFPNHLEQQALKAERTQEDGYFTASTPGYTTVSLLLSGLFGGALVGSLMGLVLYSLKHYLPERSSVDIEDSIEDIEIKNSQYRAVHDSRRIPPY
ncbi:unnamed protein product [Bursaphelenchus okinawaensis]|uniref:EGF-like domain-containing protein n=1 Tax=Bursaphelenchus okinawaensis TaxID=465554 RepID=A0A811K3K1_9BILA|nr:unnamed protein product [Bursaphelenchus okinawaensis]CAG9091213.1 unnamed protein product [Bursaphelenchus okinawaensis]